MPPPGGRNQNVSINGRSVSAGRRGNRRSSRGRGGRGVSLVITLITNVH